MVTPSGANSSDRFTLPWKPSIGVIVSVVCADPPGASISA